PRRRWLGLDRRPRFAERTLADQPVLDPALGEVAEAGLGGEAFDASLGAAERCLGLGPAAEALISHREVEFRGRGAVGQVGCQAAGQPVDRALGAAGAVFGHSLDQAEPRHVPLVLAAQGPDLAGYLVEPLRA